MRPDQRKLLEDLSEKLADVFLVEADPDNWSGDGKLPNEMTVEERGNRHWDRKGAMGTGGVLRYTLDLIAQGEGNAINDPAEQAARDADLDKKIYGAEKRAKEALKRTQAALAKAKAA